MCAQLGKLGAVAASAGVVWGQVKGYPFWPVRAGGGAWVAGWWEAGAKRRWLPACCHAPAKRPVITAGSRLAMAQEHEAGDDHGEGPTANAS